MSEEHGPRADTGGGRAEIMRAALERIRDGHSHQCGCDHTDDQTCCAFLLDDPADEQCAFCIASVALAGVEAVPQ